MSLAILGILIAVLLVLRVPVAFSFLGPSLLYMMLEGQSTGMSLRNKVMCRRTTPRAKRSGHEERNDRPSASRQAAG